MLSPHEEIRGTVDLLHREGGVDKLDRDMVGGLLDLRDLEVADVMVHRTAMMTLNADDPTEEIVRAMLASEYTRVPLWRESPEAASHPHAPASRPVGGRGCSITTG